MNNLRPKPKTKRKPVTLIVGIICTDGIVIAGDSQTTWGSGKSWSTNKMTEISQPWVRALVAESGAVITSNDAVTELSKLASDEKLFAEHGILGLAALAIRKTREKLRKQHFDCTSEELQRIILDTGLDFTLMIATYWNGFPYITTISLTIGVPSKSKSKFETIGSGSDLANYLLSDLCDSPLDLSKGSLIATHIIETAKRHDPYCGGPTKLGLLRRPMDDDEMDGSKRASKIGTHEIFGILGEWYTNVILSEQMTSEIVDIVKKVEIETRSHRSQIMVEKLSKYTLDVTAKICNEVKILREKLEAEAKKIIPPNP